MSSLHGPTYRERSARRRGGVGCRKARAETLIKNPGRQEARERERNKQEVSSEEQSQKGENQEE